MELSQQQELFISIYSAGNKTVTAAAAETGISRGTAYNWMSNKQFESELRTRQNEVEDVAYNRATSRLGYIWDRLEQQSDPDQTPSLIIQHKALKEMFNMWLSMRQSNKHEDTLRRIEKRLGIS